MNLLERIKETINEFISNKNYFEDIMGVMFFIFCLLPFVVFFLIPIGIVLYLIDFILPVENVKHRNIKQPQQQIINNSKHNIQYQQTQQLIDKQTINDHFNTIYKIHPDADEIAKSEELQQWINLLPEYDRVNVQNIIQQGTAEEVIQMLNSFKKWRNTEDEELQEQLQQYLEYLDSLSQDRDDIDIENFSEEEEILQQKLDEHLYNLNDNISIGKAYERYIGYLYEKDNWKVIFNGCIMGVEDDGIDLICQKDNEIHIIQAKNWAKKIYKKIVHQLYGSMNDYKLCNNHSEINITGIIFTTNGADYQAIKTAERLNIEIKIQKLDREYPLVKYKKTNNTYYLPPEISNKDTDKIYDELNIDYSQGDRYCKTIEDAEKLGF